MSSYFLLWHETMLISIRRGSIFIFFCFEIWDSAIWPMDIYSRQRKNPSPIDAFTNTSKNVYYELILSILSSAYIECNTHRFFHYYFFFSFCRFLLYFYRWFPYAVYWCSWNYILFSFFAFYQTSNHNSHIQAKIFSLKNGRKCISSCLLSKLKDQASLIYVNTHRSKFSIQIFYSKSC